MRLPIRGASQKPRIRYDASQGGHSIYIPVRDGRGMLFSHGYLQLAYESLLPQIRRQAEEYVRLRGSGIVPSRSISLLASGYVRRTAASKGGYLESPWVPAAEVSAIVTARLPRIVLETTDDYEQRSAAVRGTRARGSLDAQVEGKRGFRPVSDQDSPIPSSDSSSWPFSSTR